MKMTNREMYEEVYSATLGTWIWETGKSEEELLEDKEFVEYVNELKTEFNLEEKEMDEFNLRREIEMAVEVVILDAVEFEGIEDAPAEKQEKIDKIVDNVMKVIGD